MSVSKVIRGVEGEAFDRWQAPGVDAPVKTEKELLPERPGATVQELEQLQQAAYDEGFAEGRAAGRKQGYAEGQAEGFAAGEEEARALAQRMRQIFDALAEPIRQLDESVEQALTSLALAIAQQIIRRELSLQPGEILAVVREAVALLPLSAHEVSIRLHPEDARFMRETLSGGEESWKLIEDTSITPGGCHVVSGSTQINATLEQRIALLAQELLGDERQAAEAVDD